MRQRWLVPLLAVCAGTATSFACTFGANDLKVVPASGGGAGGNAGSSTATGGSGASGGTSAGGVHAGGEAGAGMSTGGTSTGGTSTGGTSTGGTDGGGMNAGGEAGAGTGGSGGAPPLKCTTHTPKPLAVMTYADLHNVDSVERFALVPMPDGTTVFAIAQVQITVGGLNEAHVVVRTISDSNNGTLRGIQDYSSSSSGSGFFQFGGAWATQSALNLFGRDQSGFVEYSFAINNGNLSLNMPTTTPFDTPMDCQQSVRDMHISVDATGGNLSFVASCFPNNNDQNSISLWINTPVLGATRQIAPATGTMANPDVNNIVRSFVRNGPVGGTNNLIIVGGDVNPAPTIFRAGASPALLGIQNPISLSSDPKALQQLLATPVPGPAGGTYLMGGTFYEPTTPVTGPLPVTIWAGEIAADSYRTLSDSTPPTQLAKIATYNDASLVFFPEDVYLQGATAFVVAEDALIQQNIQLWGLSRGSGQVLVNFPVYGNANEALSNPRIAPLSLGSLIAWVDNTSGGTEVLASSVGCF